MKRAVALAFTVALLSGCSNPHDATIPSDMSSWEKELAPKIKDLPENEREKLAQYLLRVKLGEAFGEKGMAPVTTIGQALAAQAKWESEQEAKRAQEAALKQKLEKERAVILEQLNKAVTATLLGKREIPRDFSVGRISDYQEFRVGIQNNSDKPVLGVSGEIKFIDVFDKEIGAVNFRITENIAPGASVTWVGGRDYNEFMTEHQAVWNAEDGKYTTKFIPETIVFKDGSKLTMPE